MQHYNIAVILLPVILLPLVASATAYIVYPNAISLTQNIPLAYNVYQSIPSASFSWTVWLQLSSFNQNLSTDATILTVTSSSNALQTLFLSKGKYLALTIKTSSSIAETFILQSEMPPFDQWFYAGFAVDSISKQAILGWRQEQNAYIRLGFNLEGTPQPTAVNAILTLEHSTALGYLDIASVSDTVLDGPNDLGLPYLSAPENLRYVQGLISGGTVFEGSSPLVMACPNNSVIISIDFAAYGHPVGGFPHFASNPLCDSPTTLAYIQALCIGKAVCSASADNQYFGDPCPFSTKWLSVVARCSSRITQTLLSSAAPTPHALPASTFLSPETVLSASAPTPLLSSTPSSALKPRTKAPTSQPVKLKATISHSMSSSTQGQDYLTTQLSSHRMIPEPPIPPGQLDRNGMQNGFRVKLPLTLDISSRSQARIRFDTRLAIRDISTVLLVDAVRFVLIDISNNRSNSLLTFTILSGVTAESLADGLSAAQRFRDQIQDPSSQLRQGPLLNSVPSPVTVDIECIPVKLCQSGEYICLSESSCPTMGPSVQGESSSTLTMLVATFVSVGAAVALAFGGMWFCWWNRPLKPSPTILVTLPVSTTSHHHRYDSSPAFNMFRAQNSNDSSAKNTSGTSTDAAGFRLPRSGKHQLPDFGETMSNTFMGSTPLGVSNTMTDLEQTFATLDNSNPF